MAKLGERYVFKFDCSWKNEERERSYDRQVCRVLRSAVPRDFGGNPNVGVLSRCKFVVFSDGFIHLVLEDSELLPLPEE